MSEEPGRYGPVEHFNWILGLTPDQKIMYEVLQDQEWGPARCRKFLDAYRRDIRAQIARALGTDIDV